MADMERWPPDTPDEIIAIAMLTGDRTNATHVPSRGYYLVRKMGEGFNNDRRYDDITYELLDPDEVARRQNEYKNGKGIGRDRANGKRPPQDARGAEE